MELGEKTLLCRAVVVSSMGGEDIPLTPLQYMAGGLMPDNKADVKEFRGNAGRHSDLSFQV